MHSRLGRKKRIGLRSSDDALQSYVAITLQSCATAFINKSHPSCALISNTLFTVKVVYLASDKPLRNLDYSAYSICGPQSNNSKITLPILRLTGLIFCL